MIVDVHAGFEARVRQALGDERLRTALDRATVRLLTRREESMAAIDGPRLRDEARRARAHAVSHLPALLEQLEQSLCENGCHVHWARDAREARAHILRLARARGVQHVVKSKSMVTEEIHLNDELEAAGIRVVETDLGEFIIQLAHEPPSHIIAPVVHRRAEDISELFQAELGMSPTNDPAEMCATARRVLRQEFLRADMGISGCNFAVAETGTICIITNEGNGRMVTSLPRVYVAVVGIEKVIARVEDAFLLWQAASRSATGQEVSVYFSMSSGPRATDHPDGPEEMHVVLLDNGRSRVLERGYGEALLCIRCGACLNVCPVYREIGGHAYGPTPYNGPIGAVLTPLLAEEPGAAKELPHASTLCGACRDACPVQIDLPRLLLDLRRDLAEQGQTTVVERAAMRVYVATMQDARRLRGATRVARAIASLLKRPGERNLVEIPGPLRAWTEFRDFPAPPRQSFRERWDRSGRRAEEPS